MSKSASFNFLTVARISFHLISGQGNVRKNVRISNCFTIAKTSPNKLDFL